MTDISKIKSDRIDDGIKPGDICYSLRTEKEGWLLCNGASYSATDYPDLFAVIGYTFGGSENNFNVPNYKGKFLQMISDGQSLGQELEAGLPNITGATNTGTHSGDTGIGTEASNSALKSLRVNTWGVNNTLNNAEFQQAAFILDASKSNSIYGKSSTVQPPASIVNYFIKY